jgi:heme/copper-type cytochrome/quinol oxidase subunit 2
VVAVAVPAIVLGTRALTGDGDMQSVGTAAASGSPVAVASPTGALQSCTSCWVDKGAPAPAFPGEMTLVDGVQVLNVGLVGGYYRPNRFTVQAGVPVKVVFTGWAQDCLGQPEFPELGLKGDMTTTGQAVFPLGALAPGTYAFTCSMGVNEGEITAQ